jgi:hypothetical protein
MSALLLKKNDPPAQNNHPAISSSQDSSDDGDYNEDYDEEMEFQDLFGNETNKGSWLTTILLSKRIPQPNSILMTSVVIRLLSLFLYTLNSAIDFHENIRNIRRTFFPSNAIRKQKSVTLPLQQPAPPPVPPSNPPPPNNNTPPSSNGNTPVPSPSGAGPGFLATFSNAALKSVHYVQTAPSSAHI